MSTFVHMELSTGDIQAAKQFYEGLFGWRFQDMEMPSGTYSMVMSADGVGIGGIQQNPMPETSNHWLGYVGVDSVDRAVAKVDKLGGTVIVPTTDVHGMGKLAIFTDPQGAVFAVWEAAAPAPTEAGSSASSSKKSSKKSASKKAAAKEPAAKEPTAKKAAAKKPAAKKPAAKKAAAKKPAAKQPAAKQPAAKKPAAKKAAAKKPAAKKPAAKKATKAPAKPAKKKSKK